LKSETGEQTIDKAKGKYAEDDGFDNDMWLACGGRSRRG
jgi:hypothetical protein